MTSVKKNIFKNGIASLFQKGIRTMEQLFLVPFFITAWGAAYYGEWLTLTIIPSVLAFSDMGFGTAAANSFVLAFASGDKQKAADINKSALWMITWTIILALIVSFLVIVILNYFDVFEKSLINKREAIIAVSILILARLLNFYSQLFESYYRAARKAAFGTNLNNIKAIFNIIFGLLVLMMGYGVIEFAVSQLIVVVVFNLYYDYKGRKLLVFFKEYKGKKDKKIYKEIGEKGIGYLMSPVWQSIFFQGTTFVVRLVLGAEAVTVFNTVRTLSRSANQLYSIIGATIFPELQFEIGLGHWPKAQKIFRISVLTSFVLSLIGTFLLLVFGMWFYNVWTNNELIVPDYMWAIMVLGMLINAVWWTAGIVFRSTNQPYKLAVYGVVSSVISVSVTYFLARWIGLVGAAIGCLVLEVLMAMLILPSSCKMLHMNVSEFFTNGLNDFKEIAKTMKLKIIK